MQFILKKTFTNYNHYAFSLHRLSIVTPLFLFFHFVSRQSSRVDRKVFFPPSAIFCRRVLSCLQWKMLSCLAWVLSFCESLRESSPNESTQRMLRFTVQHFCASFFTFDKRLIKGNVLQNLLSGGAVRKLWSLLGRKANFGIFSSRFLLFPVQP